jgi:hypothetical protein
MWERANKNVICLSKQCGDDKNERGRVLLPQNQLLIKQGLDLVDFIYKKEEDRIYPEKFDWFDDNDLRMDFQINVLAYVLLVCELERIVSKDYKDTCKKLELMGFSAFDDTLRIEKRRVEIKKFKLWRDKVFAHTSYTNPRDKKVRKEDNISTQLTSLHFLLGGVLSFSEEGYFQLGGYAINAGEDEFIPFPIIDIRGDHQGIIDHYNAWEEMFVEIVNRFKEKKKEEVMMNNKDILDIIYPRE